MKKQISLKIKIIILKRLIKLLFNKDCSMIVKDILEHFEHKRKSCGLRFTIKYYKAVKLHITRYMCGKPLFQNDSKVYLDKDGFPSRFLYLKELIDSNNHSVVLTLLNYSRSIIPTKLEEKKVKVDYSSINSPYKGKEWTIPTSFVRKFVKDNKLQSSIPTYSHELHYVSTKSSPNGPATFTSLWSIVSLSYNLLQNIYNIVGDYGESLSKLYTFSFNYINDNKVTIKDGKFVNGKLGVIKDPELKRRVIAMVDYTTQFTLRPIHDRLLVLLQKFNNDRTFTQNPFHNWSSSEDQYYSLDLTSATDRFPVKLQYKLLREIFDSNVLALNWMSLLTNRDYYYDNNNSIRYSVGQPMGAYSSWAAFTITHHLVVHYSAYLCGIMNFNDYILLGDDIVIKNDKVAKRYIKIMTKLGVDISSSKTHVSIDTYEFAKRWIKNGREITGIPLKGLFNNWNNPMIVFLELFNYLLKRPISKFSSLDLVAMLYSDLPWRKRVKSFKSMKKYLYDFHYSTRYSFGLLSPYELRAYLASKYKGINEMELPNEENVSVFMTEFLSEALMNDAATSANKIGQQFVYLENYLKDEEDLNLFKEWPLIHGFINHLKSLKDNIKDYREEGITLLDSAMAMRVQSMDKIVNLHRNATIQVTVLNKLWIRAINIINEPLDEWTLLVRPRFNDEIVYPVSPWERTLDTQIQWALTHYKQLASGTVAIKSKEEPNSENMEDIWKGFFKYYSKDFRDE